MNLQNIAIDVSCCKWMCALKLRAIVVSLLVSFSSDHCINKSNTVNETGVSMSFISLPALKSGFRFGTICV